MTTQPTVFISYSHKDVAWKNRLVTQLSVLQQEELLDIWDDRRIETGTDWHPEIEKAIAAAHLSQAVDGLRQAGHQEFITCGLLARAALRRAMGDWGRAQAAWTKSFSLRRAAGCGCTRQTAAWNTPGCT